MTSKSSSNTVATFLDTFKTLESTRPSPNREWPDVFTIVTTLADSNGAAPLRTVMERLHLPNDVFLTAVMSGKDRGLFEFEEKQDETQIKLTKLGKNFVK